MSRLGPAARAALLRLAREAVESRARGLPVSPPDTNRLPAELLRPGAAFVCLKQRQAGGGLVLRGCVGTLNEGAPLYATVADVAARTASEDPRFDAVHPRELGELRVEVSILSPMEALEDPNDLVPGRHGVRLTSGTASAVFLPQVAVEQGWDASRLLEHLATKAGLDEDGWRTAELSVFEAEIVVDDEAEGG